MNVPRPPSALKVVIRCRDFAASRRFYVGLLRLPILDEWAGEHGAGCIVACGTLATGARLEMHQMAADDERYQPAFSRPLTDDKIDLQLVVPSLDEWLAVLEHRWPYDGPVTLPWGGRWVQLRDPDHLLVALYEEPGAGD